MWDMFWRSACKSVGTGLRKRFCHGDVCHFTARVLDTLLQGGFPLFHARQNFRIRRHTFDIMHSLRETLTPAGVLSLVSSQKPQQPSSSSAMFFMVWKGFPFVFCAKMLKSCWFIHTTSAVLPSKSRPSPYSRTSSSSTSRSKPSRYVKNFAKSGHSEFRKILTLYCQSSYSSHSPPKMGMSLHPFEHARWDALLLRH